MGYTDYSLTISSFIRDGKYPLEAEYIFNSVEELLQWCAENQGILHDGLLKVVKETKVCKGEEIENQILFWCYNNEFYPLCDLNTFLNIALIGKFIGKTHTIEELLDNLRNHVKRDLKDLQQELDLTLLSIGLNTSGTFSEIAVQDTNYLVGAKSIISCLLALDKAVSQIEIEAFITDAGYDSESEKLYFTFKTRQDPNKKVEIDVHSLIEEWEVKDTDSIILSKTRSISGKDILTADVKIAELDNNVLQKRSEGLFVDGSSINVDLSEYATEEYVDNAIKEIDITSQLLEYVKSSENTIVKENNAIVNELYIEDSDSTEIELYTKLQVDSIIASLREEIKELKDNMSNLKYIKL